ncbi:MAG: hypothetical protein QOD99_2671 [Chthoniobacter sp.]|jgi:hypothetical protein|nr:hypothetical protein [Chthoniobacter sp.]
MSLRIFHIVFITISTLLSLALAAWEYGNYRLFGGAHMFGALASVVFAIALVVYGIWFWKKAKQLIL